jgi:hypothetical protein
MTPSIEAELNTIGWDVVKRVAPFLAEQLALTFEATAGLVATDSQSRAQAKDLQQIGEAAVKVLNGLRALPDSVKRNISISSLCHGEVRQIIREGLQVPDLSGQVESILFKLLVGLEATEARLIHDGGSPRSGSPKNLFPHEVAFAAAQVYIIGRGEMPAAHNKTAGQETKGVFGMALERLFDAMGLGFDTIGPAKAAIEKARSLSNEEWFGLMAVRCPLTRGMVRSEFVRVF